MSDKTISITVSTTDTPALREVGEMFRRLAGGTWERGERTDLIDPTLAARLEAMTTAAPTSFDQFAANVITNVEMQVLPNEQSAAEFVSEHITPQDVAAAFAQPQIVPELSGSWSPETGHVPAAPAPAAAPPAPPSATDLDGEGLPWDRRIHASTKTRRQSDNTWKLLKGIDPALVEQVKGELRAAMSAGQAPAAAPPAPAAAPPAPAAAPPAPAAVGPTTFAELLQAVTAMQMADKIAHTQIIDVCKKHGFANLPLVAARPDMIPTVYADLVAIAEV